MASANSATAAATGRTEPRRWSRWLSIAALILALIGIGFGLTVLVNSQAVIGNAHKQNAHSLEIIANDLENWPRILADVAKNKYVRASETGQASLSPAGPPAAAPPATRSDARALQEIRHPDLGRFRIEYESCPVRAAAPAPSQDFFPPGPRPGDREQLRLAGRFTDPAGDEICFSTSVPLDKLAPIAKSRARI